MQIRAIHVHSALTGRSSLFVIIPAFRCAPYWAIIIHSLWEGGNVSLAPFSCMVVSGARKIA